MNLVISKKKMNLILTKFSSILIKKIKLQPFMYFGVLSNLFSDTNSKKGRTQQF